VLGFAKGFLKQPLYRYAEAEKTNGRWAMMATAGICGQELLGRGNWWEAGAAKYDMDFLPLLAIEFVVMSFFETKRYIGFKETGSVRPHTLFLFPLCLMFPHEYAHASGTTVTLHSRKPAPHLNASNAFKRDAVCMHGMRSC
jgi:hypothetical protein